MNHDLDAVKRRPPMLIGDSNMMESKIRNNPVDAAMKRYMIQFAGVITAYVVLLVASITLIEANPDAWWRFPVAVVPVLPTIYGMVAFIRYLRAMDELQRRIHLEALAFSVGCTSIVTFTYGFLENVGLPE